MAELLVDRESLLIGDDATATFSPCREYRYALTRRWQSDVEGIAFLMLNPSTADASTLDNTIRRCVGFARAWGYGGLLVLNLFGLRSTDPKALYRHPDPVGPDNDAVIADWESRMPGPVVAAWGGHGAYQGRGEQGTALLRGHGARVMCLGTTKGGQPLHPLYLAASTPLVEFEGGRRG